MTRTLVKSSTSVTLPAAHLLPAPGCSLADLHPRVAAEWDHEANGALTPQMLRPMSNRAVGWVCAQGHHYQYQVFRRTTQGRGCPGCSTRKARPGTSLASLHPEIAAQWHPTRNDRTPHQVTAGSKYPAWWWCASDPEHVWQTAVKHRTNPVKMGGCPFCVGTRVDPRSSLAALHPEIAAQWHPTRNDASTPELVAVQSNKSAWWRCDEGHEWCVRVQQRTRLGSGCPTCSGMRRWTASKLRLWIVAHEQELGPRRATWIRAMHEEGMPATVSPARPVVDAFVAGELSLGDLKRFGHDGGGPAAQLAADFTHYRYENRRRRRPGAKRTLLALVDHRCENPRCRVEVESGHLDHRHALGLGGQDTLMNLGLLCASCNGRKGTRHWMQFLKDEGADAPGQRLGILLKDLRTGIKLVQAHGEGARARVAPRPEGQVSLHRPAYLASPPPAPLGAVAVNHGRAT